LTDGNKSRTSVATFVLPGLSDWRELQLTLFPVFLGVYLVTLAWNLGLIILIRTGDHLRTPMYFFLSFLSSIDICYSSSLSPRMLSDFFRGEKTISLLVCATQYFVLAWMGMSEGCLSAAMAYDRYVAIGRPLQYSAIVAPRLCQKMVAGVSGTGFLSSLAQTVPCFHLYYCRLNTIQYFFCDIPQIIILSCSHPYISQLIVFLSAIFIGLALSLVQAGIVTPGRKADLRILKRPFVGCKHSQVESSANLAPLLPAVVAQLPVRDVSLAVSLALNTALKGQFL
ncbi:olfactory receptor 1440, partial [Fukomys damarensis]